MTNGSVIVHLPAMCEALSSSPSIIKKKKKKDSNTNATGDGKDGETSPKAQGSQTGDTNVQNRWELWPKDIGVPEPHSSPLMLHSFRAGV